MESLITHIQNIRSTLPKQQRLLCDYICDNLFEASMLTITELAEKADVGSATVSRMVHSLGYKSYNKFKNDLREHALTQAESSYKTYWTMYQGKTMKGGITEELDACQEIVHSLKNPLYIAQLERAASIILSARRTYILGLRSSSIIASCLEYQLSEAGIPIYPLSRDPELIFDRVVDMTKEDLLLAVAAKPTTKRTMDVLRTCHNLGIPILVITLSNDEALNGLASHIINTNTFSSPLSTVPLIITAELLSREVSRINGGKNQDHYQRVEQLSKDNQIQIWD